MTSVTCAPPYSSPSESDRRASVDPCRTGRVLAEGTGKGPGVEGVGRERSGNIIPV